MRKLSRKMTLASAATAVVVAASGVAYAWWSTTGSGTGVGATTAGVTDTLSFNQTALSPMYPGDSAQSLTVAIANTHPLEMVYVSTVKAYVTTSNPGCDGTDFLLNGADTAVSPATAETLTWAAQELDAAAGESDDATGTIQFNDKASNQDACKSAVVTIHYLAT